MKYRTILSDDVHEFSSVIGEPTLDIYEYGLNKDGCKVLKKTDKKDNIYEKIQSYRESCDINNIMARFALGDTEALNVNKGYYIDTTDLPKNIFEVYERGLEAEQFFDGLPVDLKELFNNSAYSFMTADEKEFSEKISKYNEKFVNHDFEVTDVIEKESVSDNSDNEVKYNG